MPPRIALVTTDVPELLAHECDLELPFARPERRVAPAMLAYAYLFAGTPRKVSVRVSPLSHKGTVVERAMWVLPIVGLLAVLCCLPNPSRAMAASLEVGVYPVSFSTDSETMPDIEGDRVIWRGSWSDGRTSTSRDVWSDLGSGTLTYLDYEPATNSRPYIHNGAVYALTADGLRISDLESAESTTVPTASYLSGPLTMSSDGLATWAYAARSAAVFDTAEQTVTVIPYESIPRLDNETTTWAFTQPMASGTRMAMGGNWLTAVFFGPMSVWDRITGTRTVVGSSYFNIGPRPYVLTPERLAWTDRADGRVRVYEFASGETTVVAGSVGSFTHGSMDMSGSALVWTDDRHGNPDIYWFDAATGEQRRLTSDRAYQVDPAIDGARVVWADERWGQGDWDIYGTDVMPGTPNDVVPPVTAIGTTKNADGSITASLSATDPAGVAATYYSVDFEDWVEGTSFTIDEPGRHYIAYYSEDDYGNVEGERELELVVKVPTLVRLAVSRDPVRWNESVDMTVSVEATGIATGPMDFVDVRMEGRTSPSATWTTLRTVTTAASGSATLTVTPGVATEYRAVYDGEPDFADAGFSESVVVDVASVTALSAAASSTKPSYAALTTIKGTLSRSQADVTPCGGRAVVLQRQSGASWVNVASTTTLADGIYKFTVNPTAAVTYRVVFEGASRLLDPATSASMKLVPYVSLGTPVAPSTMKRGRYYTVYGSLRPKHVAGTKPVRIYRWRRVNGNWRSYGYVTAKAYDYNGYTRYKIRTTLTKTGKWRLRAYALPDSLHTATWSSGYDYVTVR